jgi:thioredoxin 1
MPSEQTLAVTDSTWEDEVVNSQTPVLVDFWAEWCGPCRMVSPVVEKLAEKYKGRLKVVKVNVDENAELTTKFGIMSIPTVMLFQNGRAIDSQIGAAPAEVFDKFIAKNLRL